MGWFLGDEDGDVDGKKRIATISRHRTRQNTHTQSVSTQLLIPSPSVFPQVFPTHMLPRQTCLFPGPDKFLSHIPHA